MRSLKYSYFHVVFIFSSYVFTSQSIEKTHQHLQNGENTESDTDRQGRLWPIGLIRFANSPCTTLEGFTGTCITKRQCAAASGTASGSCLANGIGVCCLTSRTCGSQSALNNTYFTSTDFPYTFNGDTVCTYTILPCSSNTCQVRLDFLSFILAQPDGNGYCTTDSMVVTGATSNIPIICGENSGQHMYLSFNYNDSITITVTTSSDVDLERLWSFKVTQIACDCPTLAPAGCLQYYDASYTSGTVRSFNYGSSINGAVVTYTNGTTVAGTRQLANHNYGVCIDMAAGYCSITWTQSSDTSSFTVSDNTALLEVLYGLPSAWLIGENCTTDFVVVPNPLFSANSSAVNSDRFCGNEFPGVISYTKPFILTVVTNDNESGDVANRGFSLDFTQGACRNVNPFIVITTV